MTIFPVTERAVKAAIADGTWSKRYVAEINGRNLPSAVQPSSMLKRLRYSSGLNLIY